MVKYSFWIIGLLAFGFIIYYFFFKTMLVLGQQAPAFESRDIHGQKIELSQFKGKFLLIDFWGSWCGPCRRENPILVMMYEKYKDKAFKNASGIEFLSIALENNKESGLQAIQKDGLSWPHHIIDENRMNSELAKLYGVASIPMKFLIGPDQIIMMSQPSIGELDDFLAYQVLKN